MPHTHLTDCELQKVLFRPYAGLLGTVESAAFHLEIESAYGFLKVVRTAEFQPE